MRLVVASLVCVVLASPSVNAKGKAGPRPEATKKQAEEWAARGDAWTVAGNCDEAVKAYREALKTDAKNGVVKVRLAHCLARTGGDAEAKQLLGELGNDASPVGAIALTELGDLLAAQGDLAGAVAAYDKLIARDPNNTDAKLALLDALMALANKGDPGAKARALELATRLKSDARVDATLQHHAEEAEAVLRYGDAGKKLLEARDRMAGGDARGAVPILEQAVREHPELEDAQYLLGLAYATPEVGKRELARKAWRAAAHVKEAQLQLGVDAYEGGDLSEAVKRLEGAVALDASYQQAQYQLGLVYLERGEKESAKRAWQKAVYIDPRSELGRWAQTKLALTTGNVNALVEGQIIDSSSEIGIGLELSKQVEERYGTVHDPALEERLTKILKRLSAVSDRPERELRYRIVLVDVAMINALTLPGGTILVFRGIIDMVKNYMGNTDDAWASVLGHECAHAALRHGMGMIQVASSLGTERAFVGGGDLSALLNTVSRAHEFEADQFGTLYMYRAGFNPAEAVKLHEVMLKAMGEIPRGMTHPTHKERIARVKDYLLDLRAKVHGFDLATAALGKNDFDEAIGHLEVFLGVFPDSTSARSNLGVALHRKALVALPPASTFRRSTDIDPNSRARKIELHARGDEPAGLKAEPKADERLLKEAVAEYKGALAVDATYAKAHVNLGAALDDLKDRRGAREVLERAVRLQPQSKEAWNNLGAVAAESGDTGRALEALKKAVALDGKYPEAWFNLGLTYEQAGKNKDAASAWDTYLALDGKSGWTDIAKKHRARL